VVDTACSYTMNLLRVNVGYVKFVRFSFAGLITVAVVGGEPVHVLSRVHNTTDYA